MTSIDSLAAGQYISLTTFKKDGTAVPTPVWVTRDGDHLYVITDASSGKAKRLRNSGRVTVAPCDMRGNVTGDSVEATAELLDAAGTARVERLVGSKYGLQATFFSAMNAISGLLDKLRRKQSAGRVGIRIELDAPDA